MFDNRFLLWEYRFMRTEQERREWEQAELAKPEYALWLADCAKKEFEEVAGSLPDELRGCGVASERLTNKPAQTLSDREHMHGDVIPIEQRVDRREQNMGRGDRSRSVGVATAQKSYNAYRCDQLFRQIEMHELNGGQIDHLGGNDDDDQD